MFLPTLLLACAGSPAPPAAPIDADVPSEAPASPAPRPSPVAPVDAETPPPATPEPPVEAPAEQGPGAAGTACLTATDCASGVCEGEGCDDDTPGMCIEAGMRACTRDLRPYCGCDGETFMTSGTCPGRRFASRGPCD